MTPAAILAELVRRGVRLEAAGERLRFHPRSAVDARLQAAMRDRKAELLAMVRAPQDAPDATDATDALEIDGPESALTPDLLDRVGAHKAEPQTAPGLPADAPDELRGYVDDVIQAFGGTVIRVRNPRQHLGGPDPGRPARWQR